MSVIYRALRNKSRSESAPAVGVARTQLHDGGGEGAPDDGEGGVVRSWMEYVRHQTAAFSGWFSEASAPARAAVVAVPIVLFSVIGAGVYWSLTHAPAPGAQVADADKKGQPEAAKGDAKQADAKAGIEEELFSGAASSADEGVAVTEEVAAESEAAEEAVSEEKLLAIFGDSSAPVAEATREASAKQYADKEPAAIEVSREEEEAAIGKRHKSQDVVENVVSPDVMEVREREVSRIVADLRLAMSRNEVTTVENLIVKLGKAKAGGDADPYVLNMRAYWEIANGRYDKAAALLKLILERRKDDLEAGLNMAVVEMRTNQMVAARERLYALLKLYPGDARPGEMLRYFR